MQEIKKANEFIKRNKNSVNLKFRNQYHLMAPIGWINDPNGFIYHNEEYHLFYQYYPYDSVWGSPHWGHAKSKDLIIWEDLPVALAPSEVYDINGCFSGTAIEKDGNLYLFYTGHVKNSRFEREVQCFALSEDGINFKKSLKNPVIDELQIKNIASIEDFRDPKVFERNGTFYMLVASKTKYGCGQILMFTSDNLMKWDFYSVLLKGEPEQGIMWECPDLFELDGKDVLIMSPIQMKADGNRYKNRSSTVAFIGNVNWKTGKFNVENYHEIDGGLDFYAPQTCEGENQKRYLIAWMQMWDRNMPTNDLKHGWAGSMTLPRELFIKDNCLKQKPIPFPEEILNLKKSISGRTISKNIILENIIDRTFCACLEIDLRESKELIIKFGGTDFSYYEIKYSLLDELLVINREKIGYPIKGAENPIINSRQIRLPIENNILKLTIYGDVSSMEVFTYTGEVLTATYFEENFIGNIEIQSTDKFLIKQFDIYDINITK